MEIKKKTKHSLHIGHISVILSGVAAAIVLLFVGCVIIVELRVFGKDTGALYFIFIALGFFPFAAFTLAGIICGTIAIRSHKRFGLIGLILGILSVVVPAIIIVFIG